MDMDKHTYSSLYARLTYIQVSGKLRNDTINDIHCLQTDLHVAAVDVSRLCSKRQQYPAGQLITNSSTRTCAPRTWRGPMAPAVQMARAPAVGQLNMDMNMNMLLLCSTNNCEQTKFQLQTFIGIVCCFSTATGKEKTDIRREGLSRPGKLVLHQPFTRFAWGQAVTTVIKVGVSQFERRYM